MTRMQVSEARSGLSPFSSCCKQEATVEDRMRASGKGSFVTSCLVVQQIEGGAKERQRRPIKSPDVHTAEVLIRG